MKDDKNQATWILNLPFGSIFHLYLMFQGEMSSLRTLNGKKTRRTPSLGTITSRSINAYYKHLERFNMERSRSLVSLNRSVRSGRPAILKPLKLWKGGSEGKDKMIWIYGNPWSASDPKYLRTGSGQMTRINDDRPETRGTFFLNTVYSSRFFVVFCFEHKNLILL